MNKNIAIKEDSTLVLSKAKSLINITNKILNTKNNLLDNTWTVRLWRWADKNNIPDLYYDEDLGIPEVDNLKSPRGIPRKEENLFALTSLAMMSKNLNNLPIEIANLTNLEELNIPFNKFNDIPESVYNLINLIRLNIRRNTIYENGIKIISEKICNLQKLEKLELHDNYLEVLPESITKLFNLKELGLSNNNLVQLPSNIGQMVNLKSLDIDGNNLKNLPDSITQLINLEKLDLYDNPNLILTIPQKEWLLELQSSDENCIGIDANLLDRDIGYKNPLQKDEKWNLIFSIDDNLNED